MEPVVHWVYGVVAAVADVVENKRLEVREVIDRSLAQGHMAGGPLAELIERDTLAAAAAAVAGSDDCMPKRPSRLEAVGGIHQDSGQVQHIWCQTIWMESR